MNLFHYRIIGIAALLTALVGCSPDTPEQQPTTEDQDQADQPVTASPDAGAEEQSDAADLVPFETVTLENGLKVIMHVDRSDPVVAVALTAHVGSAREKTGRTGFAHLFEHLLFLESENLGKGGLDKLSARIGGSGANGSTSRDRTNYFQTVPKDALEKMIWAEADKIGFFINTVTEPVLAKEKQVVKNEKRQGIDNRPYGHTYYVIDKSLYPEGHPYSWQIIGSLEDIQNATLDDVREFFKRWYVPNNVTLTIAGDFDPDQAQEWVQKYFGEIPRGADIERQPKQPATLETTKRLYHEDNFAALPELTMVWPTVPRYAPDSYALAVLMGLLSDGKVAPLNAVLIDDKKLTARVSMFGYESELAGQAFLQVRAFADTDLDAVEAALTEGFVKFETDSIAENDLNRIKTKLEVEFYDGIQTVLGKAFNLAQYDIFAGDPGFINQDIENIRAVTAEDVMRVYNTYIKDKPMVVTSFVPKGKLELAAQNSERAAVVEEEIGQTAAESVDPTAAASYERTPSSFDRTVEPPYGDAPVLKTLDIWESETENGLKIYGLEDAELPLVRFEMLIEGGRWLDPLEKAGRANLLAELLTKGTKARTTAELEEALALLGAEIEVQTGSDYLSIEGQTLARNFNAVMALLGEIVRTPRWDNAEFELAKARVLTDIRDRKSDPASLADEAFDLITYGEAHVLSRPALGTEETVQSLTLDDLKAYHVQAFAPNHATFHVAGAVAKDTVERALTTLTDGWPKLSVELPSFAAPAVPEASKVYFYDVPGSKQSVFAFGGPSVLRTDPEFYPARVMNYILGGGGFASRLMQELRETKGYTYGIGSGFSGTGRWGEFRISSSVQSNVTLEAAALVKSIMETYAQTFSDQDLEVTKSFLIKSKARAFESLGAKIGIMTNVSRFGLPYDYPKRETEIVEAMTIERIQDLARTHVRPDQMNYVIVGDAETQLERLEGLGFGAAVLINERLKSLRPQ